MVLSVNVSAKHHLLVLALTAPQERTHPLQLMPRGSASQVPNVGRDWSSMLSHPSAFFLRGSLDPSVLQRCKAPTSCHRPTGSEQQGTSRTSDGGPVHRLESFCSQMSSSPNCLLSRWRVTLHWTTSVTWSIFKPQG